MISLFVLVIFALCVGRLAGACLRLTNRSVGYHRRHFERAGDPLERVPESPPLQELPLSPAPPVETPLESLQRRFARGDLSMDQYERELNRLYGIRN